VSIYCFEQLAGHWSWLLIFRFAAQFGFGMLGWIHFVDMLLWFLCFFAFTCYFVLPVSVYSCTIFPVFCTHQRSTRFVEGLRYEPEGPEFNSRMGHWDFSLIYPGVESSSNTNEYQGYILGCKGGRCVGLTTFPPSCADCLEILGASTP